MEQSESARDTTRAARQPSIVEHFSIEGLFGYRSVSLSSKCAATVLIARNGSGKTTLIAALDAFLRGQFTRFAALKFEKVTCILRGQPEPLILLRSDVDQLTDLSAHSEIAIGAKNWEVEPLALLELVEMAATDAKMSDLMDNPTFYTIYAKVGYDSTLARRQCERLASAIEGRNPNIDTLRRTVRSVLSGTEIVYLPTYRRIELSIPTSDARQSGRRKSILSRLGVARSGLYTADIQFGLGDISDRLKALYSEMLYLSNQGYGKVSANIINDLISGNYKEEGSNPKFPPTKESLEIFFSRIKNAERERGYARGPYQNFVASPDLDRVYSGDVADDAKPFLNYFLDQLNSVIQQTRGSEELVEAFIGNCNRYLSDDDQSTDQFEEGAENAQDKKRLTFNRKNFKVKVSSLSSDTEVPLEALSSGEKQMISLFARLYLYPGPKIVLIDEPELSLSLDWQRKILTDVLQAPTCKQVIAITHSPFIFDNALEPFAGSLQLKIVSNKSEPLFPASQFGEEIEEDGNE
ncbi:AAA family ATPase [Variovorax paradoxus]|uniref:AAA family ATPase n=1 Tax=Variovorax paradoxus TaxID=34073 RepID=UPI00277EB0D4|nr:AAA family ATPase [Variovorax paradoxus]MDQ0591367.1 energy-coupling factor transporter ATP-binding protein EcfA2 [Variovorax paradoxus]